MKYFPAFLNLRGRICLVVGGGKVALRKIRKLLAAGGQVKIVSPKLHPSLSSLRARRGHPRARRPGDRPPSITWAPRKFRSSDLAGCDLVFACTDDPALNLRISRLAARRRLFANLASWPKAGGRKPPGRRSEAGYPGGFIVPAWFRRGKVTVAFSTDGKDPRTSRRLRILLQKAR